LVEVEVSPDQSVEDFFCQIYEKGKLLNKPEHEMLSKLISGLPEPMSFFIRAGLPQACGYRKHEDSINAIYWAYNMDKVLKLILEKLKELLFIEKLRIMM
jgi:hypothetical protein